MKRTAIGLDMSGEVVCAAQLGVRAGGDLELVAAACFERGGAGAPVTARHVQRCVNALQRQGFEGEHVALAIPLAQQLAAICELPPRASGAPVDMLAREELAKAHRCDASRLQSSVWELSAGGGKGRSGSAGESVACLAAGCASDDVEGWISVVTESHAEVVALDLRSLALMRGTHAPSRGGVLVVDLQDDHAHLVAIIAGRVVYERVLAERGMSRLRAKLTGMMRLTPAHSERWMCTQGLSGARQGERAPQHKSMTAAAAEWADQLALEASASMTYAAQRVMVGADVASTAPVLLTGPGARWAGLAEYLCARHSCDARACTPASALRVSRACSQWGDDPALMTAVGLALHRDAMVRTPRTARDEVHA